MVSLYHLIIWQKFTSAVNPSNEIAERKLAHTDNAEDKIDTLKVQNIINNIFSFFLNSQKINKWRNDENEKW